MTNQTGLMEIFRAGKHVAVDGRTIEFSAADVAEIAATYQPELAEAPLVVGHPQINAPAYGWAKSLSVKDGVLFAEPHQVDPHFATLVNDGRFKKRSASLYLRDTPGNPTPGKLYLRHIGFLGAAAPAVKGLRDAQFADGGTAVEFAMPLSYVGSSLVDMFQRLRDWFVETQGTEKADQIIPQWQIRSIDDASQSDAGDAIAATAYASPAHAGPTLETDMSTTTQAADFAAREASLSTRQTELEQREKALNDRVAQALRGDAVAFAEQLVKDGRLLPRHQVPVVELLLALPSAPISFAEGDTTVTRAGADMLRELLTSLPKQIDFAEKAGTDTDPAQVPVSFAAPPGVHVSAERSAVYVKAKAYQASHPNTSWLDAVQAVS